FYYPASHRHLPSFPTRRSSDLDKTPGAEPDPRPLQRKRPFRDVTSIGAFPASDSDPCTRERRCEWFIRTKSIGLPVSVTVRIAGAGLAGLVAATTVARAGEDGDIYEIKQRLLPSTGPHTDALR